MRYDNHEPKGHHRHLEGSEEVQQDLRLLESYGLVNMTRPRRRRTGRNEKAPHAVFAEIALKIAI